MQLHGRHERRVLAEAEVMKMFAKITHEYKLTYGEVFVILGNLILNEAGYLRKDEEEGDD